MSLKIRSGVLRVCKLVPFAVFGPDILSSGYLATPHLGLSSQLLLLTLLLALSIILLIAAPSHARNQSGVQQVN